MPCGGRGIVYFLMRDECIFCKIISGEIAAQIIYEDQNIIAIPDINPVAPVHILVIPKQHLGRLDTLTEAEMGLAGDCFKAIPLVAEGEEILNHGYRVVLNQGKDSGQEIEHLHLHLLAGKSLKGMG